MNNKLLLVAEAHYPPMRSEEELYFINQKAFSYFDIFTLPSEIKFFYWYFGINDFGGPTVCTLDQEVPGSVPGRINLGTKLSQSTITFLNWYGCSGNLPIVQEIS